MPVQMFFFFNDTATTEIYTLSLHDALPICRGRPTSRLSPERRTRRANPTDRRTRSEEHTSELQSQSNLVCRLLLEKKKRKKRRYDITNKTSTNNSTNYSCSEHCIH